MNRMSFGTYAFPYNPESLKISHTRRIVTRFSPLCGSLVEDYGLEPIRVSGEGEFFGASAETEFTALVEVFKTEGKRNLIVGGETLSAYFESLTVIRGAESRAIRFHFEFVEAATL